MTKSFTYVLKTLLVILFLITNYTIHSEGMTEEEIDKIIENSPEDDLLTINFSNKTNEVIKLYLWGREKIIEILPGETYQTETFIVHDIIEPYFYIRYNNDKEIGYYFSDVDHWFNVEHIFLIEILDDTFIINESKLDRYNPNGLASEWDLLNLHFDFNFVLYIENQSKEDINVKIEEEKDFETEEFIINKNKVYIDDDRYVRYPSEFPLKVLIRDTIIEIPSEPFYPYGFISKIVLTVLEEDIEIDIFRE